MLNLIVVGELSPEITIPEDPEELAEWFDVSMEDDVVRRQVRSKLRSIAKENSATYQSATVNLDTITPTLPK